MQEMCLPNPQEALDCLCDLVIQEARASHWHRVCQAVLGPLSPPSTQGSRGNMSLPSVLESLAILLLH